MNKWIGPLKIVMLGDGRVGKTSLTVRYCMDQFDNKQESTKNVTYLEKRIDLGGEIATLAIWDTAGQEQFNAMMPMYYRDAVGAVLVYDVTCKESFLRVEKWVEELRKFGSKDIEIVIAGNKADMKQQIQINQKDAELYAQQQGAIHFLTSAKANIGIDDMFQKLAKNISAKLQQKEKAKKKRGIELRDSQKKTDKSSCC